MTTGMWTATGGWVIFLLSLGSFLLCFTRRWSHLMENRRFSALVSTGLVAGLFVLAFATALMMMELNNSVACVPDQSALAGVCVPEDQAG